VKNFDKAGILGFATHGHDHLDAERLRYLLAPLHPVFYPFDHDRRVRSAIGLVRAVLARRPSLIVMEGTGIAGGAALLALNVLLGVPFVLCSGDAVGPYLRLRSRAAGRLGGVYERLLCRRCAGYVGWTPYLVGRAITFGAPRGMTAPGWARGHASSGAREAIRSRLGVPSDAVLVGLVGSLNWNARVRYTYGAELVHALRRVSRPDVIVCIVGDGPGHARLQELAADDLQGRVRLTGRLPAEQVVDYLAAFDVASLPQSVDRVGSFRYSTKLCEYLAAELPIITGQIPAAYDLDAGYLWRLPGEAPWSSSYIDALAELLQTVSIEEITIRREAIGRRAEQFDQLTQQQRMRDFITDILEQLER
jgi:glycosyltransferase involved in cell wall biosynthesis